MDNRWTTGGPSLATDTSSTVHQCTTGSHRWKLSLKLDTAPEKRHYVTSLRGIASLCGTSVIVSKILACISILSLSARPRKNLLSIVLLLKEQSHDDIEPIIGWEWFQSNRFFEMATCRFFC